MKQFMALAGIIISAVFLVCSIFLYVKHSKAQQNILVTGNTHSNVQIISGETVMVGDKNKVSTKGQSNDNKFLFWARFSGIVALLSLLFALFAWMYPVSPNNNKMKDLKENKNINVQGNVHSTI